MCQKHEPLDSMSLEAKAGAAKRDASQYSVV